MPYRIIGGKKIKISLETIDKVLSTPSYVQQAPLVSENLAGPKRKPKKKPKKS